ncbi:MAG: CvpA family protein [Ruminococcaceae bacterium]|nr:CvpA family protein [Oscillospiraceae bacterium]
MNETLTQFTPLVLDFMVVAILLCGAAVRMYKGLYNALMPLAVIAAAAVCGLVLSFVLTTPISEAAIPALTKSTMNEYEHSLLTVEDYDKILAKLERGMTDEVREAIDLSRYSSAVHEAAQDAGDALSTVNDEVLTDENIDSVVTAVEDAADSLTEKIPDALMDKAREAMEEHGLTGDAAREYIRQAGDTLGGVGDTVLTDENIDAAIAAVQREMSTGAEGFYGDGSEAAGREAIRAAEDRRAATEAAIGALIGFLTPRYVRVVVFLIGWVAFLAVLTTLKNTLGLAIKLPVVKQADKLGGAALGFAEAAVMMWGVLWVVRYLGFNVFQQLARNTAVLRFFT